MEQPVKIHHVDVAFPQEGTVELTVKISIKADNEIDAIGWLISQLEER